MDQKFRNKLFDLLRNDMEEFAKYITWGESIRIISASRENINLFLSLIFDSYTIRKNMFKNHSDEILFLNLEVDHNSEVTDPDKFILSELNSMLKINLFTIEDLNNFFNEVQKKLIVMLPDSLTEHQLRLFLSLKFYLKDRVQFILNTINDIPGFTRTFILNLSDEFIEYYWHHYCSEFEVTDINVPYDYINRDISQVRKLILRTHFDKKPLSIDLKSNFNTEIEQIIEENFKADSIDSAPGEIDMINNAKQETSKPDTQNTKKQVMTNPIRVTKQTEINFLTKREQKVFNYLIKKNFIKRKKLSSLVWNDPDINDDAIDQFISRMRRKFVKNGYDKNYIFVKKGEGVGISA
jgi:hypothetical protein